MKVRFDGLDVQAMVALLHRTIIGRRIVNIYDGDSNECYIFKLEGNSSSVSSSNTTGSTNDTNNVGPSSYTNESSSSKEFLVMESGIRFHITSHFTNTNHMPSPFVSKLRKHIRSLRIEKVTQINNDRIVLFQFGVGSNKHSIILELYAKGNLLLVDHNYKILSLLRSHVYQNNTNNAKTATTSPSSTDRDKTSTNDATKIKSNDAGVAPAAGIAVQVGNIYPVMYATNVKSTSEKKADNDDDNNKKDGSDNDVVDEKNDTESILDMANGQELYQWIRHHMTTFTTTTLDSSNNNAKKKKQSSQSLKSELLKTDSGISHYGPTLIEHCILMAQLKPNQSLVSLMKNDDDNNTPPWCENLLRSLQMEGKRVIDQLQAASHKETPGYILYKWQEEPSSQQESGGIKKNDSNTAGGDTTTTIDNNNRSNEDSNDKIGENKKAKILEEFQPHLLKQHELRLYDTYATFSDAVDTFFTNIAQQKSIMRAHQAEVAVTQKLYKIQQDQYDRITTLELEQQILYSHAKLIQYHATDIDKALFVINNALGCGMDWDQIYDIVAFEKEHNHNPIALLIQDINFHDSTMILKLPNIPISSLDDDEEEEKNDNDNGEASSSGTTTNITVNLNETAHGNASQLFQKYRQAKEKTQKTIDASTKAFKAAEDNAKRQLIEVQKRKKIIPTNQNKRTYYWFEKFHWFITSDNYLVIGGRDAQQNELLVKRYLRQGDAYVHADVFGASSCILRAKRLRKKVTTKRNSNDNHDDSINSKNTLTTTEIVPLSDIALREAGNFTICYSSAWSSKMITSAYWVEAHQVSKTAPTGEYLTIGAFMIRGKKNYLPPFSPLEMGFGILFRYNTTDDPNSLIRHKNERRDFALLQPDNDDNDNDELLDIDQKEENLQLHHDIDNGLGTRPPNELKTKQYNIYSKEEPIVYHDEIADVSTDIENGEVENDTHHNDVHADNKINQDSNDDGNVQECDNSNDKQVQDDENDNDDDDGEERLSELAKKSTAVLDTNNDNKETSNRASAQAPKLEKRGLSVRDRKLIKKYGSLEEANRVLEAYAGKTDELNDNVDDNDTSDVVSMASSAQGTRQANAMATSLKRGKKAKEKRALKKYADQDDEDRELALLALQGGEKVNGKTKKGGSNNNKKGKPGSVATMRQQESVAAETTALLGKDAEVVAKTKLSLEIREILAECVATRDAQPNSIPWEKFDGDTLEQLAQLEPPEAQLVAAKRLLNLKRSTRIDNYSASLGGIIRTIKRYGHVSIGEDAIATSDGTTNRKTKQDKQAELMQLKEVTGQECVNDVGQNDNQNDEAVDDTIELGNLTGKPHPDDILLFCLPVCGPYSALKQYKYSVKLTPGNMKRGKASKQCIEIFTKATTKGVAPVDHEKVQIALIKKIPDNDLVQAICSDIKINAAGAGKVAKAMSNNSKTKKSK